MYLFILSHEAMYNPAKNWFKHLHSDSTGGGNEDRFSVPAPVTDNNTTPIHPHWKETNYLLFCQKWPSQILSQCMLYSFFPHHSSHNGSHRSTMLPQLCQYLTN